MSENLLEKASCIICSSPDYSFCYETVHNRLNIDETFSIVQCSNCGFKYLNPRPSESAMHKYYGVDEYQPHKLSSASLFDRIYSVIRNINVSGKRKLIEKFNKKTGKILDIGCGTGEFLQFMKTRHWQVVGMESAKDAQEIAAQNDVQIFENLNHIQNEFDIITLWHVLEHIHNIDDLMRNVHRLLKDDGVFFIAVPNIESIDAIYYKSDWVALDSPRHLYHFRPKDIHSLLQQHRFQLVTISNKLHFDVWYNVLLSAQLRAQVNGKSVSLFDYIMAAGIGKISFFYGLLNHSKTSSPVYIFRKKT